MRWLVALAAVAGLTLTGCGPEEEQPTLAQTFVRSMWDGYSSNEQFAVCATYITDPEQVLGVFTAVGDISPEDNRRAWDELLHQKCYE